MQFTGIGRHLKVVVAVDVSHRTFYITVLTVDEHNVSSDDGFFTAVVEYLEDLAADDTFLGHHAHRAQQQGDKYNNLILHGV